MSQGRYLGKLWICG